MKKNIPHAYSFFLVTLICVVIVICGSELIKYVTLLNWKYLSYTYHLITLRLLLPVCLGISLFFRQHLRETVRPIYRVTGDGTAALVMGGYSFIVYQRLFTDIVARPEILLCFSLFLSSFVHSLWTWKKSRDSSGLS